MRVVSAYIGKVSRSTQVIQALAHCCTHAQQPSLTLMERFFFFVFLGNYKVITLPNSSKLDVSHSNQPSFGSTKLRSDLGINGVATSTGLAEVWMQAGPVDAGFIPRY